MNTVYIVDWEIFAVKILFLSTNLTDENYVAAHEYHVTST